MSKKLKRLQSIKKQLSEIIYKFELIDMYLSKTKIYLNNNKDMNDVIQAVMMIEQEKLYKRYKHLTSNEKEMNEFRNIYNEIDFIDIDRKKIEDEFIDSMAEQCEKVSEANSVLRTTMKCYKELYSQGAC